MQKHIIDRGIQMDIDSSIALEASRLAYALPLPIKRNPRNLEKYGYPSTSSPSPDTDTIGNS